jgi:hypothetical protein
VAPSLPLGRYTLCIAGERDHRRARHLVEGERLVDLPLNGRTTLPLAALTPAVAIATAA